MRLLEGVTYEFSGENEMIMDAMGDLVKMMALGMLLVYLIMVAQFQSLLSPFIVMFTIPLAFTGGTLSSADLRKGDKYHSYAGTDNAGGYNRKQRYSDGRLYKSAESPRN